MVPSRCKSGSVQHGHGRIVVLAAILEEKLVWEAVLRDQAPSFGAAWVDAQKVDRAVLSFAIDGTEV